MSNFCNDGGVSSFSRGFQNGFLQGRAHEEFERERRAILERPPAPNPPELLKPTRCRVLRPFCVGGKRVEVGKEVSLPLDDANSMRALGRVQFI